MVIRTRHTFAGASFGARSYTTPQVECDVSLFDGQPTGWQDWCNCMFGPNDPNRAKCRKRPCANPFDPDPDCVFGVSDPKLAFAPWTDPGAGIRGIPKEGGGLLYLFGRSIAPVEPYEVEPDTFIQIADRDPVRGAYIISEALKVIDSPAGRAFPYAGDRNGLKFHYVQGGGIFGQIPIIGGVMTQANAVQLFMPLGPLNGWMRNGAVAYSFQKDPSGAQYEAKIKPIVEARNMEIFAIGEGGLALIGANPVPMIAYLCRRAARMLPANQSADIEVARALLNAAAESAKTLKEIFDNPQAAFTKPGFYAGIGSTLKKVGEVAARAGDANLGNLLNVIGDTFEKLDTSMRITALAIATGNPNLLCCGPETAFDYLPERYLGFKFSALIEIADNLVKAGKATSSDLQKAALGTDKAKSALQLMQDGLNAITLFATELDKALKAFGDAGKYFSKVVEDLTKQKGKLDEIAAAARAPDPARAIANVAKAQKLTLITGTVGGGRVPVVAVPMPGNLVVPLRPTPKPTPQITPKTETPIGLVIAGAGAGFLVAGPVGALVGGGAAALLKK